LSSRFFAFSYFILFSNIFSQLKSTWARFSETAVIIDPDNQRKQVVVEDFRGGRRLHNCLVWTRVAAAGKLSVKIHVCDELHHANPEMAEGCFCSDTPEFSLSMEGR